MKKHKKLIVIIILIFTVVGFVYYSRSKPKTLIGVKSEVVNEVVRKTISASGKVVSTNEVDLSFASTGELANLYVKKGDVVKEGQLLAITSNYDTSQATQSAKDGRDVAQRDLDLYIEIYESDQDAAGGEKEYQINIRRLMELLSKAEANYQSSIGTLSKTYLYAPFEGTIVDTYKEKGEILSFGEKIVKLAKLDKLIFEIDVDQEDFGILKPGQIVELQLDSYNNTIFSGVVLELPKYASDTTEQFTVKIAIDPHKEKQVLLGMKGDAKVIVETTANKVKALTFDALFKDDNLGNFIWTEENGFLKKLPIKIGLEGDIYTELKTDLAGKTIYTPVGNTEFQEGSKVKLEK
ncbi:efflux RND transporter periplasmic adaptor subunit [candidate division WWE3 bacterium]|nr:efflux RND transporter periplasmic adaptor subunit [candidate division WWE3 bacterium]